jgi:hypothetical protein
MLRYTNANNVAELATNKYAVAYCTADRAVYTSFNFYSKTKDSAGDIMHFFAKRKAHNGALENVRVAIQNNSVLAWQT